MPPSGEYEDKANHLKQGKRVIILHNTQKVKDEKFEQRVRLALVRLGVTEVQLDNLEIIHYDSKSL